MKTLFPQTEPYATHFISVGSPLKNGKHAGELHQLHVQEYGNPVGLPVIFLHGGPGAGCSPKYSRYFDPTKYRIIMFDQRGAGESKPNACLEQNTTNDLIGDIRTLCVKLKIHKPTLFGGSWGSTLALLFAQRYPQAVGGLILRGVFLGREEDMSAFMREDSKAAISHPIEWETFKRLIFPDDTAKKRTFEEIVSAAHAKVISEDDAVWQPVAIGLSTWETINSFNADTDPKLVAEELAWCQSRDGMTMGRIEIHYMRFKLWLETSQILLAAHKLQKNPTYVVQGKLDDVCPPDQAEDLIRQLGKANAEFLHAIWTNAGHSAEESENIDALITCTEMHAARVANGLFSGLSDASHTHTSDSIWSDRQDSDREESDSHIKKVGASTEVRLV